MTTYSPLVTELKSVLSDNNVEDVKNGVITLENYFDGFKFHPSKNEFLEMTTYMKHVFVELLLTK
jgi:hypothetical protein